MKTKQQIHDFMDSYKLGVISTVNSDGAPQSAIVGYGITPDLKVIIGTDSSTRKYQNVEDNIKVSFTIGGQGTETVQLEGIAKVLSIDEFSLVSENYWLRNPYAKVRHNIPTQKYIQIIPNWVRHTNVGIKPWEITEILSKHL